jgi:hypothetical protein
MNDHQYKKLKRLYDARTKGPNERDEYYRGLVTFKMTEIEFVHEIGRRVHK